MKYYIIICATALSLLSSCTEQKTQENTVAFRMSDKMMSICDFYQAKTEDVKNELKLFGKIQADNSKLSNVYPVVGGNVQKINVELGDYVTKGQILAIVKSSEVAAFQKEKLNAGSDLAIAEKNYHVTKEMFAGKLASEKDLVAAEKELDKAKAELARINEVYSIFNLHNGSIYNITAPISGFIVEKGIIQNEQLRADKSDVLFSIAEINEVWAMANVNETDISKVKLGFDAEVNTISFPDEKYDGKIDKIFNAIDPETKAMKVRIVIPNANLKLKPQMNATIHVRYIENKKLPAVPASSIIFDKGKNWVMIYKDRTNIETRKVEVYRQIGDMAYISSGLSEGEKVISTNGILIYDALND